MTDLLFLPGAGASADFWRAAAGRLDLDRPRRFFAWPGLGNEPPDANVRGLDDLVAMVLAAIDEPADLIAQSMGGLVAVRVALAAPEKVRRLVLAAASGGVRLDDLGAADWRGEYYRAFPSAARWIGEVREDLSARLPALAQPTLLLWGEADPISPPAVGRRLQALLPDARLHVLRGAGHDLAQTHADETATRIGEHLR